VGETCGHKYRRSWTKRFGSVGIAESQLALQDVPRFVIGMVDVKDCRAAAPPLMDAKRGTSCGECWHAPIVLLNQRKAVLFRRTFPVCRVYQDSAVTARRWGLRLEASLAGCGTTFKSHRRNSHTSRRDSRAGLGGRTLERPFLGDSYRSNHGCSLRFPFRLLLRVCKRYLATRCPSPRLSSRLRQIEHRLAVEAVYGDVLAIRPKESRRKSPP
jgi:hypothetical protein